MFTINSSVKTVKKYSIQKYFEWVPSLQIHDPTTAAIIPLIRNLNIAGTYEHKHQRGRLDMASWVIYQDTQFWRILMIFNDMKSFWDLETGGSLVYPSLADLERLFTTFHRTQSRFF